MLEHPPVCVDEAAPRPLCQIRYHNGGYQYCDDQEPSHEDAQEPEQNRTRHNEKQGRKQQQAVRINANWQRSLCRVHGSSLRAVFRAGALWASVLWGNGLPAGHSRILSPCRGRGPCCVRGSIALPLYLFTLGDSLRSARAIHGCAFH